MPGTSAIVKQQFSGNSRTTFVVLTNQDNLVGDHWFPGFYPRFIDFIDSSTPDQWESPAGPEDIDADWDFDADDTTKFVASLLGNPQEWYHAVRSDLTGDDRVDGSDISAFVSALLD